ncbi:MAG: glycosyltransferase [Chloroflexi bacterium]|nr:MAG: glycosyltransferase [Chloroflexota bacterium]
MVTTMRKLVAVVVTHRSEAHIKACLDAVLAVAPAARVVVWDNASADRSADIAAAMPARIEVVRSPHNRGFAAAVNAAAALVPAADLLLVNPDAVLQPGAVAALAAALDAHPSLAVVGSTLRAFDRSPRPACWSFPTPMRTVAGAAVGLGRAYSAPVRHVDGLAVLGAGFVPFTAALLRRIPFDVLGGLDEDYWLYGEDADYCYRAHQAGWQIAVTPDAVALHLGGASSEPTARAEAVLRGGDHFREKFYSTPACAAAAAALRAGAAARLSWESVAARVGDHPRSRAEWRHVLSHYK